MITFVWFVVALTTLLRRAEGEPPWRSTIAMVSGVLLVAPVLSGSEVAAAFRANDLDPQIARYAFDEAQAAFANARVALGSFAVCCGWVIVLTRFLPRWLGWLTIASGVGLVFSRISWTSYIFLLPYGLFWLWVLVVAGLLSPGRRRWSTMTGRPDTQPQPDDVTGSRTRSDQSRSGRGGSPRPMPLCLGPLGSSPPWPGVFGS